MRRASIGLLIGLILAAGWWLLRAGPLDPGITPARPPGAAGAAADGIARNRPDAIAPAPGALAARTTLEAPRVARGRGSLRVRVTLAPEGIALPHVAVLVVALDGRSEDVTQRTVVTDAGGLAEFEALDEGRWRVELDRWPKAEADVGGGAITDLALTVPAGSTALARVLSAEGARVAGADVMLWGANGLLDIPAHRVGAVVGQTDSDGELLLLGLPSLRGHGSWLAARHPAFGSSAARMVAAPAEETDHATRVVELRLDRGGSMLEVRVTDAAGPPLADAVAVMHPIDRPNSRDAGDGRTLAHLQQSARSDPHGLVQLGPLAPGDYQLRVQAAGYATFRGAVTVDGRTRATRDVALAPEARVHGRVSGQDGAPVVGALVAVQVEPGGGFVRTGPDGRFELGGLPAGNAAWLTAHDAFVRAEGTCALVGGDDIALEITLVPLARVHGRVVDEADHGLAGWSIRAQPQDGDVQTTTSGPDGAFALPAKVDVAYALQVCEPGLLLPVPVPDLDAVRAGPDPLVIRVPADARATAFLEGTLVDAADRPAIEGQFLSLAMRDLRVYPGRTSAAAEIEASTGRFRLGPFPPGTCTLTFAGTTTVEFSVADITLLPRSTTQLGRVVVPASGTVRAELQAEAGFRPGDVLVQLDGAGDTDIFPIDAATLTGAKPVLPGHYRAKVYGQGFRWLDESIDVVAGQTTTIRGTLHPATRFALRFPMPAGERGATFRIRDAASALVFEIELDADAAYEDRWPYLDRGTFEVEATGRSGRLYRGRFAVETLERQMTPHELRVEPLR